MRQPPPLTPREFEILGLIGECWSNRQIAAELEISLPTAKNHVHSLLAKLRVKRRMQAWMKAKSLGLVDDDRPRCPHCGRVIADG